jgi:hypothetical protein
MIASDDTNPATLAGIHEIQIVFNSVTNLSVQPPIRWRMFDIITEQYRHRGGNSLTALPGGADVTAGEDPDGNSYGGGRADIRIAESGDGELYLLSKSDGMIRRFAATVGPPLIQTSDATNGTFEFSWQSISGQKYRVQYTDSLEATNWTDLPVDITATNSSASQADPVDSTNRFYRIKVLP